MSGNRQFTDLIAVAMPLYGHAALALEAIESVLASNLSSCRVVIVISVDGDPRHETFDQLLLYAAAHPCVQVVIGQGDGFVRGFEAKTGKKLWEFDLNPKEAVWPKTRNEVISTPVIHENVVYIANGQDPEHAFIAYDLGEATPEAGDLLCTARSDSTFRSIADVRNGNSSSNALHCDLVVKTDTKHNRLYAIGGNVNHAVTMSVIATDAKGRPLTDADVIGAHRWFAVLKARAGGTVAPDRDGTPTVAMLYRDYARYAGARRGQAPVPLQSRGGRAKADATSP